MRESRPSLPLPAPNASMRQAILDTLRDLERDPSCNDAARRRLRGWLPDAADTPPHAHLDLSALQALVRQRGRPDADFALPEHLLECRACMELFLVLCESAPVPVPAGAHPAGDLLDRADPATSPRLPRRRRYRKAPALAAAVLLGLWLWGFLRSPDIILENGSLLSAETILRDGRLPLRKTVDILRPTQLRFLDGSRIVLEPGTRLRIVNTLTLKPRILMEAGEAKIDFRVAESAPSLRIGDLHIFPASAAFDIFAGAEQTRLSVTRGVIQLRHPAGDQPLAEGESAAWPR